MKMGLRWLLIKKTFPIWEKLGFHVTPNHYYEPIPDIRNLSNDVWKRETEMIGIDLNVKKQIEFIDNCCPKYKNEYDSFELYKSKGDYQYFVYNEWFGEIDGDILYCMLRHYKPRTVIEIGSGYSTYLAAYALNKNKIEYDISGELISIDPYPNPMLKNGFNCISQFIEKKVQDIDFKFFEKLDKNDVLFIDSSHVVKINSDVCYEYLELLPRLKKGVLIHIHDIFLPREYPKEFLINKKYFWNETYLIQAFLMYNDAFRIIWMGNYMKLKYPKKCRKMFRGQKSQSLWIKKVK